MSTPSSPSPRTETEETLQQQGVSPSLPYALRADQLDDGTYRYALEAARTSEVLAEGTDADEHQALALFKQSLADSTRLNEAEKNALELAIQHYDRDTTAS